MSSFDVTRERLPAERLDLIFCQSPAAHSEPPDEAVLIHAVLLFKANQKHSSEFSEKCFAYFYLLVTSPFPWLHAWIFATVYILRAALSCKNLAI